MTQESQRSVQLSDGRRLAYREAGDPDGVPVFYFHGWPSSAGEVDAEEETLRACGVRLLGPDRPGMGGSAWQPGRELLDWPLDVAELADALGLERFGVVGSSGGGPYALACGYALPTRVAAVGLLCPMGPSLHPEVLPRLPLGQRLVFPLGRLEALVRWLLAPAPWVMGGGLESWWVRLGVAVVRAWKPPTDRVVLDHPARLGAKFEAGREAFASGSRGPARDAWILAGPWPFDPAEIRVPVRLAHGVRDEKVPVEISQALHGMLPESELVLDPEGGHSSVQVDELEATLRWVRDRVSG